ncbi:MAG: MBL fold metallo-hydrolase, partial [Alistipes sp.]|nr:MBL fold metallo-hydrolase [Alistipes sp.]
DVLALKDVDIAFLPVNQPYTMTVEQAARVVKALRPKIFYPYHYGQVDEKTDLEALKAAVEGVTEIRIFPME